MERQLNENELSQFANKRNHNKPLRESGIKFSQKYSQRFSQFRHEEKFNNKKITQYFNRKDSDQKQNEFDYQIDDDSSDDEIEVNPVCKKRTKNTPNEEETNSKKTKCEQKNDSTIIQPIDSCSSTQQDSSSSIKSSFKPKTCAESSCSQPVDKPMTRTVPKPKLTHQQINDLIKEIFMVHVPLDFFYLWQFCKFLKPEKPEDALMDDLSLRLVGPYDVLTGKVKKCMLKEYDDNILCHWRFYYDPPEFQTLIVSTKSSGYHIGYFRDDPHDEHPIVVCNDATKSCVIEPIADNVFAAVYHEIRKTRAKLKEGESNNLSQLELKLKQFCDRNKIKYNDATAKLKLRKTKVNAFTFNNIGIVVPVSGRNRVGYRPLPETDTDLKNILTRICKLDVDDRINSKPFAELQQIISSVNVANDESDFGMGLELGIDLFSFGDPFFHNTIKFLLPLAYDLLKRQTFAKILNAHLSNRRKGNDLDVKSTGISLHSDIKPKEQSSIQLKPDSTDTKLRTLQPHSVETNSDSDSVQPSIKYKVKALGPPVRKREERKKLNGYSCKECEEYYRGFNLSEDELKKRLKNCSRHRADFSPSRSPPHFWETGFPSTQECLKRGSMRYDNKPSPNGLKRMKKKLNF